MRPPSPTAQPWSASENDTLYRSLPVGEALRGPARAAVGGGDDRAGRTDRPAVLAAAGHAYQRRRRRDGLGRPVDAAVGRGDQGADVVSGAHRPAVGRVGEGDPIEVSDDRRVLRDPARAAVGGSHDRRSRTDRPGVSGAGRGHRQKGHAGRLVGRPAGARGAGGGHGGEGGGKRQDDGENERRALHTRHSPASIRPATSTATIARFRVPSASFGRPDGVVGVCRRNVPDA